MGRREWYGSISKGGKDIPGCMSGMLHFFDFHHILFAPTSSRAAQVSSPDQLHHYPSQLKGVEAPRNSLELDEAAATSTASALAEDHYGIPIGIQVKAAPSLLKKQSKKKKDLLQLEEEEMRMSSQSETPRTPNVVARLMGLEILSDGATTPTLGSKSQAHSSRISMKKKTLNESPPRRQPLQKRDTNILPNVRSEMGYRSLPDTPRASAERSRDADPRLYLQINKENSSNSRVTYMCEVTHSLPPSPTGGYMNKPRRSKESSFKSQDENKSPRGHYYAREIVKQVKENIHHRRENSNAAGAGTDHHLNKSRRTRASVENVVAEQYFTARPSPSTSPPPQGNIFFEPPKPQILPKPPRPQPVLPYKAREHVEAKTIKMEPASKCKKASNEKFTERIKRQPPQSETATQSDSLMSRVSPPVPLSSSPSILGALIPQKHSKKEASCRQPPLASPERVHSASVVPTQEQQSLQFQCQRIDAKEQDPEFLYVKSILERGGFMGTATTQVRWYSPCHPIDPFVFHQLELDLPLFLSLYGNDPLRHRCNRKLLFHLVQELLSDLHNWSSKPNKKSRFHEISKELLLDRVWTQIRSFPLADCQDIEDIDALVAGDLAEAKVRRLLGHPLVAAEAERVALEIEEDVLDSIIGEAAATLVLCSQLYCND